jgi:uncharacterized protein
MLILLSPAKTLDYANPGFSSTLSPRMLDKSQKLIEVLRKLDTKEIMQKMDISEKLAILNKERYENYHYPLSDQEGKTAIHAFKGDVYQGLEIDDFTEDELLRAHKRIRILSGLYGLLRPFDLILPYRLEMGTNLPCHEHKNLYEFWGEDITNLINEDAQAENYPWVINLASQEYFKSVKPPLLKPNLLTIKFLERRNGTLKTISFNAKKARGEMARALVLENIFSPNEIKNLSVSGYHYSPTYSSVEEYTFIKE